MTTDEFERSAAHRCCLLPVAFARAGLVWVDLSTLCNMEPTGLLGEDGDHVIAQAAIQLQMRDLKVPQKPMPAQSAYRSSSRRPCQTLSCPTADLGFKRKALIAEGWSPTVGLGYPAVRDIEPGTRILVEKMLFETTAMEVTEKVERLAEGQNKAFFRLHAYKRIGWVVAMPNAQDIRELAVESIILEMHCIYGFMYQSFFSTSSLRVRTHDTLQDRVPGGAWATGISKKWYKLFYCV
ncbi:hypothetical protein GGR50DRAFT_690672 [Xylaria sp. CBS 124048]|nr:hypothetical protein GGR50DRAFT_690672 [Xylaria sp. CBS 124048]